MEAEKVRDDIVTVSDDYRVVIPEHARERLGLKPGDDVAWILFDGSFRFIRVPTMAEARGSFKGMDTSNIREEEDRECQAGPRFAAG